MYPKDSRIILVNVEVALSYFVTTTLRAGVWPTLTR